MLRWASLRLGTIKSVEVNVNVTWLIVFGLLVYWLRNGFIGENAPNLADHVAWIVSAVAALVLFASVLAHELAHSLVAVKNGLPIRRITLFIFGGIAHMESEPPSPGVELKMAVAGPLVSIAIACVLGLVRFVLLEGSGRIVPSLILEYATYANAVLAGFNLVPGYPLDGGRVLRATLWKLTGNLVRSTSIAALIGRLFGLLLVFAGAMFSVAWEAPGFLWLILVGTFLERLAFISAYRVRVMHGGLRVRDIMAAHVVVISASMTLETAAAKYFASGHTAYPVLGESGLVGIVSRSDLAAVPREEWQSTTVESAMTALDRLLTTHPDESAGAVLRRMLQNGIGRMPVVSDGRLIGIVTRTDLVARLSGGLR